MAASPRRAAPPRIPADSPVQQQEQAERREERRTAEARERSSMVRGLVLLGLLLLVLSMARAGLDRVFPHGWGLP